MNVRIVEKRVTAAGCRQQYVAKGFDGSSEFHVAFRADEELLIGGQLELARAPHVEVYTLGNPTPRFLDTGAAYVRDPNTGLCWPVDDLVKSVLELGAQAAAAGAAVNRLNSQLQSQPISPMSSDGHADGGGPISVAINPSFRAGEMVAVDPTTGKELGRITKLEMTVEDDPVEGWTKRLAEQEAAAKNRALERAAQAAIDLGMEFELLQHAELSGGGGESPYELRLHTARGAVSHRKRHGESWDEAVRALGL